MTNDIEYILDACAISHFLRGKSAVVEKFLSLDNDTTYTTPITIAEAYFGMMKSPRGDYEDMKKMIHSFGVIPLNEDVAIRFAELKNAANIFGSEDDMDLWMVAFCEVTGATLLTTDGKIRNKLIHVAGNIEVLSPRP